MDQLIQAPTVPKDSPASLQKGASMRYKMRVLDESGAQSQSLQFSSEDKERENELRKFFETKINNATTQLYIAETKISRLTGQYSKTKEDLKKLTEERDKLQKELEAVQLNSKNLKEETETTKFTYEEQMNVLTEFISGQNEKISTQTEVLNEIKRSRVYCGRCKRWNTLEWLLDQGQNGKKCSGGNHGSFFNYI